MADDQGVGRDALVHSSSFSGYMPGAPADLAASSGYWPSTTRSSYRPAVDDALPSPGAGSEHTTPEATTTSSEASSTDDGEDNDGLLSEGTHELSARDQRHIVSSVLRAQPDAPAFLVNALMQDDAWRDAVIDARSDVVSTRPLEEDLASMWSTRFNAAMRQDDPSEQLRLLSDLRSDFLDACRLYGTIICSEAHVPDVLKTIQPTALGGVAGGSKFKVHGILFKFARDALVGPNQYLYGGDRCDDAAARKAMGNELKAAGALFKASVGTPIRVPLMALLDFRGFRLCCQAVVPLSGAQFVYGSADGGKTVHAAENNPQLLESVQLIARRLNIAAHPVREASTNTIKEVSFPVDIEIHQAVDGQFYSLDVARLMPPTAPRVGHERRIFCEMFRPEFVRRYAKSMSADSFSRFGLPGHMVHDPVAVSATQNLELEVIPAFARSLEREVEGELTHERISFVMHEAGINMRYLGLVRKHVEGEQVRQILLEQMLARVLKKRLQDKLHKLREQSPLLLPYRELVARFFEKCASADPQSSFWRGDMKRRIISKFGEEALNRSKERRASYSLLYGVRSLDWVMRALADFAGVRTLHPLENVSKMAFLPVDFTFEASLKEMSITTVAMAQTLIVKSKSFRGEQRLELLREARAVLGREAAQAPKDESVVLKLAFAKLCYCFDDTAPSQPMTEEVATIARRVQVLLERLLGDVRGPATIEPLCLMMQLHAGRVSAYLASEDVLAAAEEWTKLYHVGKKLQAEMDAASGATVAYHVYHPRQVATMVAEGVTLVLMQLSQILAHTKRPEHVEAVRSLLAAIWNAMIPAAHDAMLEMAEVSDAPVRDVGRTSFSGSAFRSLPVSRSRRRTILSGYQPSPCAFMAARLSGSNPAAVERYLERFDRLPFRGLAGVPVDNSVAAVLLHVIKTSKGFDFSQCDVTDSLHEEMHVAPTYLNMTSTKITDAFLVRLSQRNLLESVRVLFLDQTHCSLALPPMPQLETLSVRRCSLTAQDLVCFAERAATHTPALRNLDVSLTESISRESLRALAFGLPHLVFLDLSSCVGVGVGLLKFPVLRTLHLSGCRITDDVVESLASSCPSLLELDLSNNRALTFGALRSLQPLALQSLSLARCTLLDDELFAAIDGAMAHSLQRLELTGNAMVSQAGSNSFMEAHPSCVVVHDLAQDDASVLPDGSTRDDTSSDEGSSERVDNASSMSERVTPRARHESLSAAMTLWQSCRAALVSKDLSASPALIAVEGSGSFKASLVLRVRDLIASRMRVETIALSLPRHKGAHLTGSFSYLRRVMLDALFLLPHDAPASMEDDMIEKMSAAIASKQGSTLSHADARASLRALVRVPPRNATPQFLKRTADLAAELFAQGVARLPMLVIALHRFSFIDPASDALLVRLLELRLPRCVFMLFVSADEAQRGASREWFGAALRCGAVVLRAPVMAKPEPAALHALVLSLPDVLRRTLVAASLLGRSVDVAAVAFILTVSRREVLEHFAILCERSLLFQDDEAVWVAIKSVRSVSVRISKETDPRGSRSLYIKAAEWLARNAALSFERVKLLRTAVDLVVPAEAALTMLLFHASLDAVANVTSDALPQALEVMRSLVPFLDSDVASLRQLLLRITVEHVKLLHLPYGVCRNPEEAERLVARQRALYTLGAVDEALVNAARHQECMVKESLRFTLPEHAAHVAPLRDLHAFANAKVVEYVELQQLSACPGPCATSALVAKVSLLVREMTLRGTWGAARGLLQRTSALCQEASLSLQLLIVNVEAVCFLLALMGKVTEACDMACEAQSAMALLVPSLPPHPLVEAFFLPLALFCNDPQGQLVSMLRRIASFPAVLPQFGPDCLVVLGLCPEVPALLMRQIGIELLQWEDLGHVRYHAFALRCLGVADSNAEQLRAALELCAATEQHLLHLHCLTSAASCPALSVEERARLHEELVRLREQLTEQNAGADSDRLRSETALRKTRSKVGE